jgi:hypothetical protein
MAATGGPAEVVVLAIVSIFPVTAIIPIVTSLVTIYYLTRPKVKAFFGRGPAAAETHGKHGEVN